MKPLAECLDILLLKMVEDWNNYGDERKDLNCEELLTTFGLEPQYRKHEFFVGLIDKLIKDCYAELIDSRPFDSKISKYQKNTITTITGYYFRLKQGGYTKDSKIKKIADFPKTNWLLIAVFAFVVGLFTDLAKTAISQMLLPNKQEPKQATPISEDSGLTHKNHLYYHLDTFYIGVDTFYISK